MLFLFDPVQTNDHIFHNIYFQCTSGTNGEQLKPQNQEIEVRNSEVDEQKKNYVVKSEGCLERSGEFPLRTNKCSFHSQYNLHIERSVHPVL